MKISAFTIVRNEELLISKHMCHLASLADEVVVIVQPSTDATLLFAKHAAHLMFTPTRVVEHAPEKLGWEFSLDKAMEECKYDWVFFLPADETYVGAPLSKIAGLAKSKGHKAAAICRQSAIACNPMSENKQDHWFKIENAMIGRLRLMHKASLPKDHEFTLHRGPEFYFNNKAIIAPIAMARVVEYKPSWYHYKTQLFICAAGHSLNEVTQCESLMPTRDLRIGQAFWEKMKSVYDK